MLLPKPNNSSPEQHRLLKLFKSLSSDARQNLLSYAEFLAERDAAFGHDRPQPTSVAEPVDIPRPPTETVIEAIRRLSQTYPMIEKDDLLHETSDLMTAHVMRGRSTNDVIDELEVVFRRHYERVKSGNV